VNFGKHSHKFKPGSRPEDVLNHMAKMFPLGGCLMHVDEDGLIVLLQEEVLSQPTYSYVQPGVEGEADGFASKLSLAVLCLQARKRGELTTIGMAVVCSSDRLILIASHYLAPDFIASKRAFKWLRIGGMWVDLLVHNEELDLAVLWFKKLDVTIPLSLFIPCSLYPLDRRFISFPTMEFLMMRSR
jgi:hypothetical protein